MKNHYIVTLHVSTDMEDIVENGELEISGCHQALQAAFAFNRRDAIQVHGTFGETRFDVPEIHTSSELLGMVEDAVTEHAEDLRMRRRQLDGYSEEE